ncbi:hypothetical protein D3C79_713560 [compost metagenome]
MAKLDACRQGRQAAHLFAIDMQDKVITGKAGRLAPPGTTNLVGHALPPEPIHEAHPLPLPGVKCTAQAFQPLLKAAEMVPKADPALHQVEQVSVQLSIGQGRENFM